MSIHYAIQKFSLAERARHRLERADHELAVAVTTVAGEDMAEYVQKTEQIVHEAALRCKLCSNAELKALRMAALENRA